MPSAPVPANRSSTRAPSIVAEHREQRLAHAVGGRPRRAARAARFRRRPPRRPGDHPHACRIGCQRLPRRTQRSSALRRAAACNGTAQASGSVARRIARAACARPLQQLGVLGQARELELPDARLAGAHQLALLAQRRSISASLKPSECSASARRRGEPARAASRHVELCSPRPTRPRSWCSWEIPKRSAFSTSITVALGTSTPTSITVVATSTWARPDANASIASCFSRGRIWPCSSSRLAARQLAGAQTLELGRPPASPTSPTASAATPVWTRLAVAAAWPPPDLLRLLDKRANHVTPGALPASARAAAR